MRQPIYIIEDFYGNILFSEERSGVVSVAAVGEKRYDFFAGVFGTGGNLNGSL